MRILTFILVLALSTLPFGMGAMMASASTGQQMHMAGHGAGQTMPMKHHHAGKQMSFAACSACVWVAAQAAEQPAAPGNGARYRPRAQQAGSGTETLPATPPPRS